LLYLHIYTVVRASERGSVMKNKSVGAIADSGAFYVGMRANFFDTVAAAKSKISFLRVPENYFMDPKVRRSPVRLARSWFSISLSLSCSFATEAKYKSSLW
jgi:hypothetical protein